MNILILGEKCHDIFIYGNVNRLSPEAPIPIINPSDKKIMLGMAYNVYQNIFSLSEDTIISSKILTQNKEIKKTRYIDTTSSYILLRIDEDDFVEHSLVFDNEIKEVYFKNIDAVVISDYNKGFLTEDTLKEIFEYCNTKKIITFMDTKKILGDWSMQCDFVKINEKEYKENLKYHNVINYCKSLIVTKGPNGCTYLDEYNNLNIETNKVEVRDVTGAGDTFLAGFVVNYLQSLDVIEAMKYANRAASFAVSKSGIVVVKPSDIN